MNTYKKLIYLGIISYHIKMNLTEELYKFCESNNIKLVGNYENVKKTTPIYFNCSACNIQQKKSYKCLTKNKDIHVSIWSQFCHKCFRSMNY